MFRQTLNIALTLNMGRSEAIALWIVGATTADRPRKKKFPLRRFRGVLSTFFVVYKLPLRKERADLFEELRTETWHISEEDYISSFRSNEGEKPETALESMADMGYSGSVSASVCPCTDQLKLTWL